MRPLCAAAILCVLVGLSCKPPESKVSPTETNKKLAALNQTMDESKGWRLSTDTDRMDNTPRTYLAKSAEGSDAYLLIRCIRGQTDLLVHIPGVVGNGNVRLKFDDAKPQQQVWSEAEDYGGLFAPNPIALARRLTKAESFLFEYKPFQKGPTTVEFKVHGLAEKLGPLEEACGWAKIDRAKAIAEAAANAAKANAEAAEKADAARTRKRDAMLREALSKYVGACHEQWLQKMGRWCWYDESSSGYKGGSPFESEEACS